MKASAPVADTYIPAMQRALFWQSLFFCLSALILDFFYINHLVVASVTAHWFVIVMILIRRPESPTSVDLFFCRAYPLYFGIAFVIAPRIMGHDFTYRTLLEGWLGISFMKDGYFSGPLALIPALAWLIAYPFLKPPTQNASGRPPTLLERVARRIVGLVPRRPSPT